MNSSPELCEWNERLFRLLREARPQNLLCQCIVGSHVNACRLRPIHDIDIVTIIEPLNGECLSRYWASARHIANELSNRSIHATVEIRSGPLSPEGSVNGHIHVQLHLLTHSKQEWAKVVHYPGGNRWVRNSIHISGETLGSLLPVPRVTTNAIHRDLCIITENILSSTAYCRVYELSDKQLVSKLIRVPLSPRQYANLVVHGGILGYENVIDLMMGGRLCAASHQLRNQFSDLVDRLRGMKREMDEGLQFGQMDIVSVCDKVLRMLRSLQDIIKGTFKNSQFC